MKQVDSVGCYTVAMGQGQLGQLRSITRHIKLCEYGQLEGVATGIPSVIHLASINSS